MNDQVYGPFTMSTMLFLVFMIFLPVFIYLVSFLFINDKQTTWYNSLEFKVKINAISGYKAIFVGSICFFAAGLVGVLILKHHHDVGAFSWKSLLLPLALLLSNIGFIIAFQTKTFTPHCIFSSFAATMTVFLMFYYGKNASLTITATLVPLLLWQLFNVIFYSIGMTTKEAEKLNTD